MYIDWFPSQLTQKTEKVEKDQEVCCRTSQITHVWWFHLLALPVVSFIVLELREPLTLPSLRNSQSLSDKYSSISVSKRSYSRSYYITITQKAHLAG